MKGLAWHSKKFSFYYVSGEELLKMLSEVMKSIREDGLVQGEWN